MSEKLKELTTGRAANPMDYGNNKDNGGSEVDPYATPGFVLDMEPTFVQDGADPDALVQVSHPDTLRNLDINPGRRHEEKWNNDGSRTVTAGVLDALPSEQSAYPAGFDPMGFDAAPRSAAELIEAEAHRQATVAHGVGQVSLENTVAGYRMNVEIV